MATCPKYPPLLGAFWNWIAVICFSTPFSFYLIIVNNIPKLIFISNDLLKKSNIQTSMSMSRSILLFIIRSCVKNCIATHLTGIYSGRFIRACSWMTYACMGWGCLRLHSSYKIFVIFMENCIQCSGGSKSTKKKTHVIYEQALRHEMMTIVFW